MSHSRPAFAVLLLLVTDQLARRGDAHPAAQRAAPAIAGDARRLAVPGHEELHAQQLLDLLDLILFGTCRGAGRVDLGEHGVERGVRGRFLRDARGGEHEVGGRSCGERSDEVAAGEALADERDEPILVELDVRPRRARLRQQ